MQEPKRATPTEVPNDDFSRLVMARDCGQFTSKMRSEHLARRRKFPHARISSSAVRVAGTTAALATGHPIIIPIAAGVAATIDGQEPAQILRTVAVTMVPLVLFPGSDTVSAIPFQDAITAGILKEASRLARAEFVSNLPTNFAATYELASKAKDMYDGNYATMLDLATKIDPQMLMKQGTDFVGKFDVNQNLADAYSRANDSGKFVAGYVKDQYTNSRESIHKFKNSVKVEDVYKYVPKFAPTKSP